MVGSGSQCHDDDVDVSGISSAKLDAKGRLTLPVRFRERLIALAEGKLTVTLDPYEKCLLLYSRVQWKELEQQLNELPNAKEGVRWLQRILAGFATDLDLDGNGRILLPAELRNESGLEQELVLVGQGKKVEIWPRATWRERVDAHLSENGGALFAEAEEIAKLSI